MIFDEHVIEVLNKSEHLNQMILNSHRYHDYVEQYKAMQQSKEVNQMKQSFLKQKEKYDEVMRFRRYHPDYMEVMLKTRRMKKEIDMHPLVAAAKKAEMELQTLLDEVLVIVTNQISSGIMVERGNPFFTDHQCGSSCSCSA